MSVKDYNAEPALNVSISGINIAEGCAPSGINDAIRQLMADVKEESEAQAQAVAGAEESVSALEAALRSLIAQEVAKCLKLTGGTMAGTIVANVTDIIASKASNSSLRVHGGEALNYGASLILYGKDSPNMDGRVQLCARNGTPAENNDLVIGPNGYFALNGIPILTSAGGNVAKLLSVVEVALTRNVENSRIWVSGGTNYNGGALILYGSEHADCPNEARLKAGSTQLRIMPEGGAMLGGSKVLTEASGSAYAAVRTPNVTAGVVDGNAFTLPAGGRWAYTYHRSMHSDNAGGSGIAAGGTTITAAEGPTAYFAIRIE